MSLEITSKNDWVFVEMGERIDAFNYAIMREKITHATYQGPFLVVSLVATGFLSLQAIKFLHVQAVDLQKKGGQLALISPSEKIKRQFDIFASLDPLRIFATESDWSAQQEGIKTRLMQKRQAQSPLVEL